MWPLLALLAAGVGFLAAGRPADAAAQQQGDVPVKPPAGQTIPSNPGGYPTVPCHHPCAGPQYAAFQQSVNNQVGYTAGVKALVVDGCVGPQTCAQAAILAALGDPDGQTIVSSCCK